MRVLVTGADGMLGRQVCARLTEGGALVLPTGRGSLDITDRRAVRTALLDRRPDVVVNCAAWTAVDRAEREERAALAVNGRGPAHLAAACGQVRARLIHVSTDYVFHGTPADVGTPMPEHAEPDPRTAYGRTKLAGERAVRTLLPLSSAIVRTGWLYGAGGPNFVRTMAGSALAGRPVEVVADQYGQPTWTVDVADRIAALAAAPAHRARGIFHATSCGFATWHTFAREIYRLLGADPGLVAAVSSECLNRRAPRPIWSVLSHDAWARARLGPPRHWHAALAEALGRPGDPSGPLRRELLAAAGEPVGARTPHRTEC
ncbi:dTDP-4-dehydrorhamnose reductase [Streptomyces sp. NBC_01304]|uniref:dTDP-4-dehydrorhamnose reductase n=1 Tax=Streptomyces sp. NBC_01304 TaxID=2903818 RepID=UPI002E11EB44|nr:dTDP-4-dehydrorhamnose reductase [Streptomyces sp. NBC_01304]